MLQSFQPGWWLFFGATRSHCCAVHYVWSGSDIQIWAVHPNDSHTVGHCCLLLGLMCKLMVREMAIWYGDWTSRLNDYVDYVQLLSYNFNCFTQHFFFINPVPMIQECISCLWPMAVVFSFVIMNTNHDLLWWIMANKFKTFYEPHVPINCPTDLGLAIITIS